MANLPGPAFWEKTYGFHSFDQFYEEVGRFIPNFSVYHVGATQQTIAELAWQSPSSLPGIAAAVMAAARGAGGMDEPSAYRTQAAAGTAAQIAGWAGMSQLIVPGVFQVVINGKAGGQDVINVVGVQNGGGDAAGASLAVLNAWKVTAGPLAQLSSLYLMSQVIATDIGNSNGTIHLRADTTQGGGGIGASFATAGACALVKWNGGTRSRSSRGRLYFGPIQESNINADGRTLTSGASSAMTTAFNNFRTSLSGAGYPLVVVSRVLSQAFPVTSSAVEVTIATQRRRIRK